ncbi:MAG: phosphohistidine phosphatase SixA [Gammaproteobacteria bacterium]|jgi:phosphohistidine phosphatase
MLYLVQHGQAVSKDQDPDRPLSSQGESDVSRMAALLAAAGIVVDRIVHSGKTRAEQTAAILANSLSDSGTIEVVDGINPNDSVAAFADQVVGWNTPVMVVGHLPFMAKLVTRLAVPDREQPVVEYQPGTVVCMAPDDSGHWAIQWMVRPELLP